MAFLVAEISNKQRFFLLVCFIYEGIPPVWKREPEFGVMPQEIESLVMERGCHAPRDIQAVRRIDCNFG